MASSSCGCSATFFMHKENRGKTVLSTVSLYCSILATLVTADIGNMSCSNASCQSETRAPLQMFQKSSRSVISTVISTVSNAASCEGAECKYESESKGPSLFQKKHLVDLQKSTGPQDENMNIPLSLQPIMQELQAMREERQMEREQIAQERQMEREQIAHERQMERKQIERQTAELLAVKKEAAQQIAHDRQMERKQIERQTAELLAVKKEAAQQTAQLLTMQKEAQTEREEAQADREELRAEREETRAPQTHDASQNHFGDSGSGSEDPLPTWAFMILNSSNQDTQQCQVRAKNKKAETELLASIGKNRGVIPKESLSQIKAMTVAREEHAEFAQASSDQTRQTVVPTDAPTDALTGVATDAPTQTTTDAPKDVPTNAPTHASTNALKNVPTDAPTQLLYDLGDDRCYDAGTNMSARDASCRGDLVCARIGFDGRNFGNCDSKYCCSDIHDGSKCTNSGLDCCASESLDEPRTCADGYIPMPDPQCKYTTNKSCASTACYSCIVRLANLPAQRCHHNEFLLYRFQQDGVIQDCCPMSSFACAGCAQYDAATDTCVQCQGGFVKKLIPWTRDVPLSESPQCEACVNNDGFVDPRGYDCAEYEKQQLCVSEDGYLNESLSAFVSGGLSPLDACCACGGGKRRPTPFSYPISDMILPLSTSNVIASPVPRTASLYSAESCDLHKSGFTLDKNGTVSGHLKGVEGPTSVTCEIRSEDQHFNLGSTAEVVLTFEQLAYPSKTLVAYPGATFIPQKNTSKTYHTFTVVCTPHLPWLGIDESGRLLVQNVTKLIPRRGRCTVSTFEKWCPSTLATAASDVSKNPEVALLAINTQAPEDSSLACMTDRALDNGSSTSQKWVGQQLTLQQCKTKCLAEFQFNCAFFSWWENTGGCLLSLEGADLIDGQSGVISGSPWCHENEVHASVNASDKNQSDNFVNEYTGPPTEPPTELPTEEPTFSPTSLPTEEPTLPLTEFPTEEPTSSPTEIPTEEPTLSPTEFPTEAPTEFPTESPTELPTESLAEPTAPPAASPIDDDCVEEPRATDVILVVPNEATALFLVHTKAPREQLFQISTVVGEEIEPYRLAHGHNLHSRGDLSQIEGPSTFHLACGSSASFDDLTGILRVNGHTVLSITREGVIKGKPSPYLMKKCRTTSARCNLQLSCTAYGVLPITKNILSMRFGVFIYDNVCWRRRDPQISYQKVTTWNVSLESCRAWCRSKTTCAAFAYDPSEGCSSVRVGKEPETDIEIFLKVRECSAWSRCIELSIPNTAYVQGEYCPMETKSQRWPLFKKEGSIEEASLYLQKYDATIDHQASRVKEACGNVLPKWVIRTSDPFDFIGELIELHGRILFCISKDVLESTYLGSGVVEFIVPIGMTGVLADTSGQAEGQILPESYDCPSPLTERAKFLEMHKIPNEFQDEDAALKIFRFDDVSTSLHDDYSLGPCECPSEDYGDVFPVRLGSRAAIPPGSGNMFTPPPQLLAQGGLSCDFGSMTESIRNYDPDLCKMTAMHRGAAFFWVGESAGTETCRLFSHCRKLQLNDGDFGELFAVPGPKSCAIADPETCWSTVKRRKDLTGFTTLVEDANPSCLFEELFHSCDHLRMLHLRQVQYCGTCAFAASPNISLRRPLPSTNPSGTNLRVSCHPDKWRAMLRGGTSLIDGMDLTCVDGRWVNAAGEQSMMRFTCEAAVHITAQGHLNEPGQLNERWWSSHYGKLIRHSSLNSCLVPSKFLGLLVEFGEFPKGQISVLSSMEGSSAPAPLAPTEYRSPAGWTVKSDMPAFNDSQLYGLSNVIDGSTSSNTSTCSKPKDSDPTNNEGCYWMGSGRCLGNTTLSIQMEKVRCLSHILLEPAYSSDANLTSFRLLADAADITPPDFEALLKQYNDAVSVGVLPASLRIDVSARVQEISLVEIHSTGAYCGFGEITLVETSDTRVLSSGITPEVGGVQAGQKEEKYTSPTGWIVKSNMPSGNDWLRNVIDGSTSSKMEKCSILVHRAPTSAPPAPPASTTAPVVCFDTCAYSNDSICDDGGSGSSYSDCDIGTDCLDCGARGPLTDPESCGDGYDMRLPLPVVDSTGVYKACQHVGIEHVVHAGGMQGAAECRAKCEADTSCEYYYYALSPVCYLFHSCGPQTSRTDTMYEQNNTGAMLCKKSRCIANSWWGLCSSNATLSLQMEKARCLSHILLEPAYRDGSELTFFNVFADTVDITPPDFRGLVGQYNNAVVWGGSSVALPTSLRINISAVVQKISLVNMSSTNKYCGFGEIKLVECALQKNIACETMSTKASPSPPSTAAPTPALTASPSPASTAASTLAPTPAPPVALHQVALNIGDRVRVDEPDTWKSGEFGVVFKFVDSGKLNVRFDDGYETNYDPSVLTKQLQTTAIEHVGSENKQSLFLQGSLTDAIRVSKPTAYSYVLRTSTACLTSDGSSYIQGLYDNQRVVTSLSNCESLCNAYTECKGIRWNGGRPQCAMLSSDQAWVNNGRAGWTTAYQGHWSEPSSWSSSPLHGYECYEKQECVHDWQCAEGVCVSGTCQVPCGRDSDCSIGYVCGLSGACLQVPCGTDSDCSSPSVCGSQGFCDQAICANDDSTRRRRRRAFDWSCERIAAEGWCDRADLSVTCQTTCHAAVRCRVRCNTDLHCPTVMSCGSNGYCEASYSILHKDHYCSGGWDVVRKKLPSTADAMACANMAANDPQCGPTFYFIPTASQCRCVLHGQQCQRVVYSGSNAYSLKAPKPACPESCPSIWLGDGECDSTCQQLSCNWDNGDCESPCATFTTAGQAACPTTRCIWKDSACQAGKFKLGMDSTNYCPLGYSKIEDASACEVAAQAMSLQYFGVYAAATGSHSNENVTYFPPSSSYPGGCGKYIGSHYWQLRTRVYFNEHKGAARSQSYPICIRTTPYTCENNTIFLSDGTLPGSVSSGIQNQSECESLCDNTLNCYVYSHDKFGGCYLKVVYDRGIDDAVNQTISCRKTLSRAPTDFLQALNTAECPPCPQGVICTCLGGEEWQATVPADEDGSTYNVLLSFTTAFDSSKCLLNNRGLNLFSDQSVEGLRATAFVTPTRGALGVIRLHPKVEGGCRGLKSVQLPNEIRVSWAECRREDRQFWAFEAVPGNEGRFWLRDSSSRCIDEASGLLTPCDKQTHQIVSVDDLACLVKNWTYEENGRSMYTSGCVEYQKTELDNALQMLAKMGAIGDAQGRSMISFFMLKGNIKGSTYNYEYTYRASQLILGPEGCVERKSMCKKHSDGQLFHLESHAIQCMSREAIQHAKFTTCTQEDGQQGFQYIYKCCRPERMGGCEIVFSPWSEVEDVPASALDALSQLSVACPSSHVLKDIFLEAKTPKTQAHEVRYVYECCIVEDCNPIFIETESVPLPGSFAEYEGAYYPESRVEGRVIHAAGFLYDQQAEKALLAAKNRTPPTENTSLAANNSSSAARATVYDKFVGEWCVKAGNGTKFVCAKSDADHVLHVTNSTSFQASELGPFLAELVEEGQAPMKHKKLKEVKFKKAPKIEDIKLEALEFEPKEFAVPDPFVKREFVDAAPFEKKEFVEAGPFEKKEFKEADQFEKKEFKEADQFEEKEFAEAKPFITKELLEAKRLEAKEFADADAFEERSFIEYNPTVWKTTLVDLRKTVTDWIPSPPDYKPYCVLKDLTTWEKYKNSGPDALDRNLLGTLSRNREQFIKPYVEDNQHPCYNYFSKKPEIQTEYGLTPQTLDGCRERSNTRSDNSELRERNWEIGNFVKDQAEKLEGLTCDYGGDTGGIVAPMGLGAVQMSPGDTFCQKIFLGINTIIGTAELLDKNLKNAEDKSDEEKEGPGCDKPDIGMSFKAFCDLHCIEDAVQKGNAAVLQSMKDQTDAVVKALTDTMHKYTQEIFSKVDEIRNQINHNGKAITDLSKHNAKQVDATVRHTGKQINDALQHNAKHADATARHNAKQINDVLQHNAKQADATARHNAKQIDDVLQHNAKQADATARHNAKQINDVLQHNAKQADTIARHNAQQINDVLQHNAIQADTIARHNAKQISDVLQHNAIQADTIARHNAKQITDAMNHNAESIDGVVRHTGKSLNDVLQHNAKAAWDQFEDFKVQFGEVMTDSLNSLQSNLDDNIRFGFTALQAQHKVLNENLDTLMGWLNENNVLNPSASALDVSARFGNATPSSFIHAWNSTLQSFVDLVGDIHRGSNDFASNLHEGILVPSLEHLLKTVRGHASSAEKAISKGDFAAASGRMLQAKGAIHQARADIDSGFQDTVSETFQRRTFNLLAPSVDVLLRETLQASNAHLQLRSFEAEQRAIFSRHTTLRELSEQLETSAAAEMMVRFDAEVRQVRDNLYEYLNLAHAYLWARSDAVTALHQGAEAQCRSPETLQKIGLQLAKWERAQETHLAGLDKAWRQTAIRLSNMADIMSDGGLLLHEVRLAAFSGTVASSLLNESTPLSASEAVMLVEGPLQEALRSHAGAFVKQISRAFDISQFLANMWGEAFKPAPEWALKELRASWGKVMEVAGALRVGLRNGGRLRRELLMNRLESIVGPLDARFAVPVNCKAPSGAVLWRHDPAHGTAVLLSQNKDALHCDLRSGEVQNADEAVLALHSGDLGDFLQV